VSVQTYYIFACAAICSALVGAHRCSLDGAVIAFCAFIVLGYFLQAEQIKKQKQMAAALLKLKEGKWDEATIECDEPELAAAFASLAVNMAELDKGQRKWVADTSHELRTPIAVLRAQVEAFQDGVQAVTPRNMEVLHKEIMALSKLVDDLHWLAKSDVGAIKPTAVPVDINQSLQDVLEGFEERRASKAIKLENLVPSDTRLIANADASRIRQVLTNVIENSLRYTNKGGSLKITHELSDTSLKLFFDDTEPGVATEILPKIFDRFYRAESSRSRTLGGSGLGLAICLNNMQLLGGSIEAHPSELGGLKITVTLPMMAEPKA